MTRVRRLDGLMASNRSRAESARPRSGLRGVDGPPLRARRTPARRRDDWKVRAARLLLVLSVVAFGFGLWTQPVRSVRVEGVVLSDRVAVEEVAALLVGQRWVAPSSESVVQAIGAHGWVREVRVSRRLPDSVRVRVTESVPVAWAVRDERAFGVADDGRVAAVPARIDLSALPRVEGLFDGDGLYDATAGERLVAVLDAVAVGGWPFPSGLADIDLRSPHAVVLRTHDDVTVRLDPGAAVEQLRVAGAAWSHLDPASGDALDLRFARQAVLSRAPSTPNPAATGG